MCLNPGQKDTTGANRGKKWNGSQAILQLTFTKLIFVCFQWASILSWVRWKPKSLLFINTAHLRNAETEHDFLKKAEQLSPIRCTSVNILAHSSPRSDPVTKGSEQKEWPSGDLRDSIFKF